MRAGYSRQPGHGIKDGKGLVTISGDLLPLGKELDTLENYVQLQ
jgi:hypothetical protein